VSKLRLDSWKSIAEYLERSPRTVQRWHAYHGLPVHHFRGSKGSVFAYAEEIDRWLVGLAGETRVAEAEGDDALESRKSRSQELTTSALEMWETRSEENLNTIAGLYRRAIDLDPGNAKAFTGLANSMISAAMQGVMDGSVAYPCAMEALRRSTQLCPDDVDTLCATAWLEMIFEQKWRLARTRFEKVLQGRPQNSFALAGLALLHIAEGDPRGASLRAWEAWSQNTLVCSLGALVCWSHYLAGDFDSALELVEQVRSSGGFGAMLGVIEALALIQSGMTTEKLERIELVARDFPQSLILQGILGHACALVRQTARALEICRHLERMHTQKKRSNAYGLAVVHLGLGRDKDAAEWLKAARAEGSIWSFGIRNDPMMRPLRGNLGLDVLAGMMGAPTGNLVQGVPTYARLARAV
jgi:tetratricopeptide (TPR) repeat protein